MILNHSDVSVASHAARRLVKGDVGHRASKTTTRMTATGQPLQNIGVRHFRATNGVGRLDRSPATLGGALLIAAPNYSVRMDQYGRKMLSLVKKRTSSSNV
jgi:hypothetical protein